MSGQYDGCTLMHMVYDGRLYSCKFYVDQNMACRTDWDKPSIPQCPPAPPPPPPSPLSPPSPPPPPSSPPPLLPSPHLPPVPPYSPPLPPSEHIPTATVERVTTEHGAQFAGGRTVERVHLHHSTDPKQLRFADVVRLRVVHYNRATDKDVITDVYVPLDKTSDHQLETIDALHCEEEYELRLSVCRSRSDAHGGCGPEVAHHGKTHRCVTFPPKPPPARPQLPPSPPALPPPPPLQPPPPSPPAPAGCLDPSAATYDPEASANDPAACRARIWGCTLSMATNYNVRANLNDGSCTFARSRCTLNLADWPFVTKVVPVENSPFSSASVASGSNCTISRADRYRNCLSVRLPVAEGTDTVIQYELPPGLLELSVEVGLSPRSERRGRARFEMRLVDRHGRIVGSDSTVRGRLGMDMLPAALSVRGESDTGMFLELRSSRLGGISTPPWAAWAEPLIFQETNHCIEPFGTSKHPPPPGPPPPRKVGRGQGLCKLTGALVIVGCIVALFRLARVAVSWLWQATCSSESRPLRALSAPSGLVGGPTLARNIAAPTQALVGPVVGQVSGVTISRVRSGVALWGDERVEDTMDRQRLLEADPGGHEQDVSTAMSVEAAMDRMSSLGIEESVGDLKREWA